MGVPNDNRNDGNIITYLSQPYKWEKYDADLFLSLKIIIDNNEKRTVQMIENCELFKNAEYFSLLVPDLKIERSIWFNKLLDISKNKFIFLDPDNGLEVKSKVYGRKESSKYIFWDEISCLWRNGNSLLIYQHFPRVNRNNYISNILGKLSQFTIGSKVDAFYTSHVVYLLALQPVHQAFYNDIRFAIEKKWSGKISCWSIGIAAPRFVSKPEDVIIIKKGDD